MRRTGCATARAQKAGGGCTPLHVDQVVGGQVVGGAERILPHRNYSVLPLHGARAGKQPAVPKTHMQSMTCEREACMYGS